LENLKKEYIERDRKYYRNSQESKFYCVKINGTKEIREWLIFSETSKSIYCFVCKLFSSISNKISVEGFNDWKNVSKALAEHESSKEHITCMCTYHRRCSIVGRTDTELTKQLESNRLYWREVLNRIVATVKLISGLGLAFRGHDESVNSERKDSFLSCIDYLREFDPFLKRHLEMYNNRGQGKTDCLSHHICDEFVNLIEDKVKNRIIEEIKEATYYSIIVDSTPDISHTDQLSLIIRYVSNNGSIYERFLGFLPIENHYAEYLENAILKTLHFYFRGLKIILAPGASDNLNPPLRT
jgi:hypothetical protein